MDTESIPMSGPWYTSARFRTVALWLAGLCVVGCGIDAVFLRDNDFEWHCSVGRAFLRADDSTLAAGASWYPLGRRMLDVVLLVPPYRVSRAIAYGLAIVCLAVSIRLWRRMAEAQLPVDSATAFAVGTMSLVFLAPHLSRDLQECGLQLFLLAMLSAAAYALWSGRSMWAGFWLALAVTYKTTPALFLPVLLWKRQWRTLATSVVLIVFFNLMPACYLGWDMTVRCYRQSWEYLQASSRLENIADNGIEYPNPRNQALISLFARYLQSYPPDHPLYLDHPAFLQFGDLDHATARLVAKLGTLLLAGFIAWRLWGRWTANARELPAQWSAICVFAAIVSPMCWRQHLVLALPALYLLLWSLMAQRNLQSAILSFPPAPHMRRLGLVGKRLGWLLLGASVFLLWAPQSEVIGNLWASVLMAYKPDTFVFIAWSLVLLHWPHGRAISQALRTALPPREIQRARAA